MVGITLPETGLLAGWTLYYLSHSLLASTAAKAWAAQKLPSLSASYRLFFNGIALGGAGLLGSIQAGLASQSSASSPLYSKAIGILLLIAAGAVVWVAFKGYSLREFAGLSNHTGHPPPLNTGGLNGIVRHPLYFATVLALIAICLWKPSRYHLIWTALSVSYLWIGSEWEERKLIRLYGKTYLDYRSKVRRLIPFVV